MVLDSFSFLLGSISTLFIYRIGKIIYKSFPYLSTANINSPNQNNEFIIISGATDGIGRQYVKYLHQKGYNIFAIGRNISKLTQLSKQQNDSRSIIISELIDFNEHISYDQTIQKIIEKILLQYNQIRTDDKNNEPIIKGVINCCGKTHFNKYQKITKNQIESLHNVNFNSLHLLIKTITNSNQVKFSNLPFFINISSMSAHIPIKYSTIYSGIKAYQSQFINSVRKQLKSNWKIINVEPWFVKTKMINYRKDWDSVQPKQIVQGSFKLLNNGFHQGKGCLKHELIYQFYPYFRNFFQTRTQRQYEISEKITLIKNRKNKQSKADNDKTFKN